LSGGGAAKRCICGACHAQVKSVTSYFLHWVSEHQEATSDTVLQEVWQCKACPANITRLFPDTATLVEHVSTDHGGGDCDPQRSRSHCNFRLQDTCCPLLFPDQDSCNRHFASCHVGATAAVCGLCHQETEDACRHFTAAHACRCTMCGATYESLSEFKSHCENRHRCVLVWSRRNKLEILTCEKILGNGNRQSPARLANGAIVKSPIVPAVTLQQPIQESTVAASSPVASAEVVSSSSSSSSSISEQQLQQQQPSKVLQNAALREKFIPVAAKAGFACVKCGTAFFNEKLMEKHYFANHEFRCKFCELVMDKDNYGVHLRQHLATERRKNQCY